VVVELNTKGAPAVQVVAVGQGFETLLPTSTGHGKRATEVSDEWRDKHCAPDAVRLFLLKVVSNNKGGLAGPRAPRLCTVCHATRGRAARGYGRVHKLVVADWLGSRVRCCCAGRGVRS
jgi:hypothetical protein